MKNKVIAAMAVFFLILLGAVALRAEELQPGVGRVSLTHGDVSMQRGDSGDWVAATINTPIVAGDWLLTATRSRAEVQLDYGNVLRLGDESEAKINDLTRTKIQVQVRRGLINFDSFKNSEADTEINTPNVALRPIGEGSYRVLVVSDEETQVIVRKGEADVTTPQGSTTIKKGDLITIRGRDNPEYQVSEAPKKDDWDDWNKERDSQILDARSYERTSPYYTGVSDLDRHGRWIYIADYGWVWTPAAGPDWVPYRSGRWVWEPYWGWTWVSYEPWGWAPYHYGRWFRHANYWCWWPGPVYPAYRPIWAPAYVAFFGFGRHHGFSAGFGFGNIGWLPIGPGDYYHPWWGGYRRNVNVINITNINVTNIRNVNGGWEPLHRGPRSASNVDRVLKDPQLRRGMTAMPSTDFGRRAVPRTRPVIGTSELRQSQMVAGNVPVVPTRESLRAVDRPVRTPSTRGEQSDRFFTRTQPTSRPPAFQTEAAEVRDAIQRRGSDAANQPGAPARPGLKTADSDKPADARGTRPDSDRTSGRPGTRLGDSADTDRPGRPARDAANQPRGPQADTPKATTPEAPKAAEDRPGWRRFGGDRTGNQADRPTAKAPERQTPDARRDSSSTEQPRRDRQARSPNDRTPPRSDTPSERPGFRKFTPQDRPRTREDAPARRGVDRDPGRDAAPDSSAPRRQESSTGEERPGFRPFTPQPDRPARSERAPSESRGEPKGGDRPAARTSEGDRGPGRAPAAERPRDSGRPPLDFHRPIVEPRAPAREGGSRTAPSAAPSRPSGNPGGHVPKSPPPSRSEKGPRQR